MEETFSLNINLNKNKNQSEARFPRLSFLLAPKMWVPRGQTQPPGSFSREREGPGDEIVWHPVPLTDPWQV